MKLHQLFIPGLLFFTLASVSGAPALKVGDPAPALKMAKWFKGQPVEKFESNSVYVVEFWSTICAPCTQSAPHLSEVARKFAGKARVIGVSVKEPENLKGSETPDHAKRLEGIAKFLTKMGAKMDYTVAADDNDGFMQKNWLDAADEQGIPVAFIVGKDGKIAWIGHPLGGLEETLAQAVAGTLDPKAVEAEAKKRQDEKDERARVSAMFQPVHQLQSQGKPQAGMAALERLIAEHPELESKSGYLRFRLWLDYDEPAASRQARKLLDGEMKDNAGVLYMMTRDLTEPPHKQVDWEVALAVAKRTAELRHHDADSLCVLAQAWYRKGDFAMAIKTQEQARELLDANPDSPASSKEYCQKRLAAYRAAQQKQAAGKTEK
jgi:thiol-disulfide isomerase/thioredoxin